MNRFREAHTDYLIRKSVQVMASQVGTYVRTRVCVM